MKAPKAKRRRGRPKTHGLSRTRAYRAWHWTTYESKHRYFSIERWGHPISLCKEWQGKKGIIKFYEDMGEPRPGEKLQVRDVTQPFSKANCYWEQRRKELTKEQSTDLDNMLRYIGDHSNYLDRWETGFCKRMRNFFYSGSPIILKCFFKIKVIFEKLSTRETLSSKENSATIDTNKWPYTVKDDYAGGAPRFSTATWEDVQKAVNEYEAKTKT